MNPPADSQPCIISACESERYTSGLLCSLHRGRLLRALREIPEHATTITRLLGHTSTPAGDHVSGSKERPLPAAQVLALTGPEAEVSSHADLMGVGTPTVLAQVGSWARDVEACLELIPQTYPASLQGLYAACQTIVRNYEAVCALPQVDEMYGEIETVWRNVRMAAGDSPQPQRGEIPCPSCSMRALFSPEPGEPYQCRTRLGGCGSTLTEADHDAEVQRVGSAFLEHDEAVSIESTHEAVAEALHWRDSGPKHVPKPGPDDRSLLRGFGTAHDVEEVA